MKMAMFWMKFIMKFGMVALFLGVVTFINQVGCDVDGIVDLEVNDEEEVFEETSYLHESEHEKLMKKKFEDDSDYDLQNAAHRRMYAGKVYKEMFQKLRLMQHEATKAVTKFGDYEKRHKLVSRMLHKLFETLEEVKMNTTLMDIQPGPMFPEDEEEQAMISKIYENVFLFGDLLLRMPDMVHSVYDQIMQWRYVLGWAKQWCDDSRFFEGPSKVILEAIFQEVNIIRRDDDWKPDYSNMTEVELDLVKNYYEKHFRSEELAKVKKKAAKNEKKEKKKIKKGPRLSKTEL